VQDALNNIKDKTITITVNTVNTGGSSGSGGSPDSGSGVLGVIGENYNQPSLLSTVNPNLGSMPSQIGGGLGSSNSGNIGTNYNQPNITVVLNGQVVGNAITDAQVNQSASGIPNTFTRSGTFS
jgi:hypothetical protein